MHIYRSPLFVSILALIGLISLAGCQRTPAQEHPPAADTEGVETITILQTADIHGQLLPHQEFFIEDGEFVFKERGGVAHIQTIFKQVKAENPGGTVIVDGGDLIQGSAVAALSEGAVFGPVISAMDYDFLIPGNWEVIFGSQKMQQVLASYGKPVVCANIYDEASGKGLYPPYLVKEVKGVKLGFISYNDPEVPIRQNPTFSKGLVFKGVEDNLQALIKELKEEQGVDILFLVTHIGISKQLYLADQEVLKGVDFILGNDTHERIRQPIQRKYAQVVEPGAFASFVGRLDLDVKRGKIVGQRYELLDVDPARYPADPAVQKVVEEQMAPYKEQMEQVLGYTTTPLYRYLVVENPMDNMITDALRWKTGADIAISNGFRFSTPIVPDASGRAPITYSDVWNMLPVNERVKLGKATGRQVRDWMEQELHNVFAEKPLERFGGWVLRFSGMEMHFNANAPRGRRVQSITVGGQPLDPDRLYTLAACRRSGEPEHMLCRMPHAQDPQVLDYTVHDVLEEYLKEKGTVAPTTDGRARALDLEDPVLSQLPHVDYVFR
ncbi:bifunctional metallophosphatase/5'-nucleotidase [Cesiribacter andamanensis]|uniref:Trifunctional nucleotide phosphoesterase protein YfkN n=1 Tax=Cesiribacter andamanensis AMV16 TaxID=1279009 RepID=M7NR84_9BACT|nr:bifunctional metallophosphatase/5'-nucleotidase [Cesiribacter andamanensis]EMR01029.1 Trifunctional nucleotide phosphoesterase protein YfkN precursor [Cesiribacter andamanensis AMV16]